MKNKKNLSRRKFIRNSAYAATGSLVVPSIIPASVIGANPPSEKIQIAQIGFGRIASSHDLPETMKNDIARIVAVCDVDTKRMKDGKQFIEKYYREKKGMSSYMDVKMYQDYREMLKDSGVDAVIISTPDHWHARPTMDAALAGKDIYLQKPTSLTIAEGRAMADAVARNGAVFQIGSQQRSATPWPQFKKACELVRNGRIGKVHTIKIGLPGDPGGDEEPEMDIPSNLDYEMWLGSTPYQYYTEKRVHPQHDYSRPGWLRCEQFGAGMITGWGAHHIDIAHWGMGTEFTGPIEIEGTAEFPKSGLWNVHGDFLIKAKYANGVTMEVGGDNPNGVRFEGSEGWIFVTRGNVGVTSSDPTSGNSDKSPFQASDPRILSSVIGPNEVHLYESPEQHKNWLDCIKSRSLTVAPAEVAHRSCSTCLLFHTAMKIPRKLYWDPVREKFKNDDEANAMLYRPQRHPWGTNYAMEH
ncbi:Gfo/Idh/MocA family protein [Membranihabitans marinus]|uniref:Gfo/Idh/MocA family protein n=1 Tax=Membranihabitans marinus TaxID=1227546 RepID=UPI001F2F9A46|nr:Gfo/Idh/MocA family oxidoreductase [Membranihabitans marinus]